MSAGLVQRARGVTRARVAGLGLLAAAVQVAGLMTAVAASAGTAGPLYSTTRSGYQVSGTAMRYVQAEVALPSDAVCARLYRTGQGAGFTIGVSLGGPLESLTVHDIPTSTGCGRFRGVFITSQVHHPVAIGAFPGQVLRLSVYDDHSHGQADATVANLTEATSATVTSLMPLLYLGSASVTTALTYAAPPASQFRAVSYYAAAATTATGQRGTLAGSWTTRQVIMTSNGHGSGTIEASSPVLWNNGSNFSTWVRAAGGTTDTRDWQTGLCRFEISASTGWASAVVPTVPHRPGCGPTSLS